MDKTVYNEAAAVGTSGKAWDRVNNKSGMGFEAGRYDWGDIGDVTLRPDRDRGYACARVTHCEAYRLMCPNRIFHSQCKTGLVQIDYK